MKSHRVVCTRFLITICIAAIWLVAVGIAPALAVSGEVVAEAVPSNAYPAMGEEIEVAVNIDMTNVDPPDNELGSYTASLQWDPAVLKYMGYSGGTTSGWESPTVNDADSSTGLLRFSDANPNGSTGKVNVINVRLKVIGWGSSVLDLEFSAMAAAKTFNDLLPILTVNDGSVTVTDIEVTSPNGGEDWTVGSTHDITWN